MQYDTIIIGARCAGAATAMQLARAGQKVLVLDRTKRGTDTMSTHALMRGAVLQLYSWGLLDQVIASNAPIVNQTRFCYGKERFDVPVHPSKGTPGLIAPRRYVLDGILADAAQEAGAEFKFGCSFVDVLRDKNGNVEGVVFDGPERRQQAYAPLVIGADGRRSTVARRVGSKIQMKARHASTCVYAYFDGVQNEGYQWSYQNGLAIGAIPTHDNLHCVFASTPSKQFRELARAHGAETALRQLVANTDPEIGDQLITSNAVSKPVVFGGDNGFIRESAGQDWALVGDAGYFKDPLTAHGITDAFRDAELLSKTILTDASLKSYEDTRNAYSIELFELTNQIASFDWNLAELKAMHLRLNEIMKAEQGLITRNEPIQMAA